MFLPLLSYRRQCCCFLTLLAAHHSRSERECDLSVIWNQFYYTTTGESTSLMCRAKRQHGCCAHVWYTSSNKIYLHTHIMLVPQRFTHLGNRAEAEGDNIKNQSTAARCLKIHLDLLCGSHEPLQRWLRPRAINTGCYAETQTLCFFTRDKLTRRKVAPGFWWKRRR